MQCSMEKNIIKAGMKEKIGMRTYIALIFVMDQKIGYRKILHKCRLKRIINFPNLIKYT